MKVLLTGGSGFVGNRVCQELVRRGHQVVAPLRRPLSLAGAQTSLIGDLGPDTDWSASLRGCDVVVHCAARAHILQDRSVDPVEEFRRINRDGTFRLAQQARTVGVQHFLFISTIKVNGETTPLDKPFRAEDPPNPQDAYSLAKAEAEEALRSLGGMTVTIVRPPLVHGSGVKGNLAVLIRAIAKGWPLPFGLVRNRRSLVGVENLADAVAFLVEQRPAGTFLIRDDGDLSTADLIRALAAAMHRPARLLPVPVAMLMRVAHLLGRQAMAERVLSSLLVDDAPLRTLGWQPPFSLDQGLTRMAEETT